MTDAIGAAFLSITLVLILGGLAAGGIVGAVVTVLWHGRRGATPTALQYLVAVLALVMVVVSVWGVVVIGEPAPQAGTLFAMTTFVPLILGVGYGRLTADGGWLAQIATATIGWSLAFVPGFALAIGLLRVLRDVLEPAAEPASPLPYVAAITAGIVMAVVIGAIGTQIRPYFRS